MLELIFLISWIFLKFFLEVSCSGWVRIEFGTKIFFLSFSTYLIPFWLKLMPERGFLIFWFLFLFFFWYFLVRIEYERDLGLKFFLSFSAYLILFWLKIMSEMGFLIFWIFLLFFSELSCPGRVWMEFGRKIVFSLSRPMSSRFGQK